MDFPVHAGNLVEAGLHDFAGGNFLFCQPGGEFRNGGFVECHKIECPADYSTIFGTMNSPLALAGAFCSASSWESDSPISSTRVTLINGTACAVGWTLETSSSFNFSI